MSDKKRPWFQVHLASLLVASIVAGFLMLCFLSERNQWYRNQGPSEGYFRRWGFPFIAYAEFQTTPPEYVNAELPWYEPVMAFRCKPLIHLSTNNGMYLVGRTPRSQLILCVDILLCLIFVGFATLLTEYFLRHREARAP